MKDELERRIKEASQAMFAERGHDYGSFSRARDLHEWLTELRVRRAGDPAALERLARTRDAARLASTPLAPADPPPPGARIVTGELVDWINQYHIATPGVEAVVQSLKERHEAGLAKYGQPLYVAEGPPSRPPVVDLAQELLDALVYAMQAKLYGWPCPTVAESDVLQLCVDALSVLQGLMADQKP